MPIGFKLILKLDIISVLRVIVIIVAINLRIIWLIRALQKLWLLYEVGKSMIPGGRNMTVVVVDVDTMDILLDRLREFLRCLVKPFSFRL